MRDIMAACLPLIAFEQRTQHSGVLFVDLHALGEQVGGRLIVATSATRNASRAVRATAY